MGFWEGHCLREVSKMGPLHRSSGSAFTDAHHMVEIRYRGDVLEPLNIVNIAPTVGHNKNSRPRLPQYEANFACSINMNNRDDSGSQHERRLICQGPFHPIRHPNGNDIASFDAEGRETRCELKALLKHFGQGNGDWCRPTNEMHIGVGKLSSPPL